ncbi:DUF1493 family protein [Salmonella sp. S117-49695]
MAASPTIRMFSESAKAGKWLYD